MRLIVVHLLCSLNHLTSSATPNPALNPRFNSLFVDGALSAGSFSPAGGVLSPPVVTLSAATASQNLGVGYSGSIIQVPTVTVNTQVILGIPAQCAGQVFKLRFIGTGNGTNTVTLISHASATNLIGSYTQGTATGVNGVINGNYQVACSASIPAGTRIDAECDGTWWHIRAVAALASAFTVT